MDVHVKMNSLQPINCEKSCFKYIIMHNYLESLGHILIKLVEYKGVYIMSKSTP